MRAGFPDPFAVATVGGEQTKTTSVIKKTLNPYWNESFDMYDKPSSLCAPRPWSMELTNELQEGHRREYPDRADFRPEEVQEEGSRLLGRHQRSNWVCHGPGHGWRWSVLPFISSSLVEITPCIHRRRIQVCVY